MENKKEGGIWMKEIKFKLKQHKMEKKKKEFKYLPCQTS